MYPVYDKTKQAKQIYLAGKIGKNDWRHEIVDGLRGGIWGDEETSWPILKKSIFGRFDYVGPFFVGCNHGCYHGDNSHGFGLADSNTGCVLCEDYRIATPQGYVAYGKPHDRSGALWEAQKTLTESCLERIKIADLVFAWINSSDAYGSLVEVGYALGLQQMGWQGKIYVVYYNAEYGESVAVPYPDEWPTDKPYPRDPLDDLWFLFAATNAHWAYGKSPKECLQEWCSEQGWMQDFESPLEESFWQTWQGAYSHVEITPQHKVFNGRYRLDFAHLSTKIAIELDGFTYHNQEKAFQRDRQRDRDLNAAGWRVIRFASNELREDIAKCAKEAYDLIINAQTK